MTEADFQELKRQWRANAVASFLVSHARCCEAMGRDDTVLAWLEPGGFHIWCRYHGERVEIPDVERPASNLWDVLCAGVATEHPRLFAVDLSGEILAACVNRLAAVLRRAALLSTAGSNGAAVSLTVH